MAPRTKRCTSRASGAGEPMEQAKISMCERSQLSAQDHTMLKNLGLFDKEAMLIPGDESTPHPPINFWVTFIDFLIRGLSVHVHEFLRFLLFVYGIQLHQLTPNSIIHVSNFITLCECFLGIHPHWGLWKRIFYLRRNNSKTVAYNVGGVVICIHPDVDYFDVKFADSVQAWRKKWLYIKDESSNTQEYAIAPFDAGEEIQRRKSWDAEARKNPMWMYSGPKDSDRVSAELPLKDLEKIVRRFTLLTRTTKFLLPVVWCPSVAATPFPRTTKLSPLFLHFPKVEKWMSGSLLLTTRKNPLCLRVNPQDLTDLRVPLTNKQTRKNVLNLPTLSLLLLPILRKGPRGNETMSKIPAHPSLPKNLPRGNNVPSTPSPILALLAQLTREKKKKRNPQLMGQLLRAPPTRWFFPKKTVLLRELRLSRSITQEHQLMCPAPPAPKSKKARTGAGSTQELATGGTSNPLLEDPLMKKPVNLGSRFIRFRDEAATLRDALRRAEERAAELDAKLEASETARKKAEKDASAIEGLR
ncbi:hypothetical protein QYE76_036751 [Lolium multiflorum]|uniref:Transposase (putative) gypsy type domain-containing protein n=1 Tax=Lolium multiflorum TaxID=4521 RepID=A0AAD8R5G7_LOLMU|nr:hypothetical protein QYE76_036751 [Lolium multiflorum]